MLENIIIKDVLSIFNVFSKKGFSEINPERKSYGLSFCKSGKITYIQNGKKYISDENCAVILPKGASYKILRQETGFFPVINFECDNFHTDEFLVFPINNSQILIKMFNEISEHFNYKEKLEVKSILYKMFSEITKYSKNENTSRAINYIYKNIGNPELSNKQIADYLNISETYLNKQFFKNNGTTPKKFIQNARMKYASKLLSENTHNINEIAEICGFSSIYSFSRAFKNYTNMSPTEYKKNIWSEII